MQSLEELDLELNQLRNKTYLGGGRKRIEAHKAKNKMTARERIDYLLDEGDIFMELGLFAAKDMYEPEGGCPAAGVVVGLGKVSGRLCVIVANDATVKAGAWFPMTAKKNLRAQEIAMENKLPIIYLVDSAGVFLPMQSEVFADKEHFGRIFRNNAVMSSMGIVQVAAIMGSCVAGGAYLPIMSDEAFIVEGTGSVFLAGSYLVKSAIGEDVDNETLGGATTQTEISGVTDNKFATDQDCLDAIKKYFGMMGDFKKAEFSHIESRLPIKPSSVLADVFPADRVKPYNMLDLLDVLVDEDSLIEYKPLYGKTIICGYARIEGWAVGIVANQRKMVKNKKGEMQIGGVIYSDSADKAARFIMNCNQRQIPILFIHDVTGFMVGSRSEHNGIIKDGAKMVNAVANSVVPKLTLIVGNSFGAGNYAMCGKAYDPRFIYAWPSAQIAVMSGGSASKTLVQIQKAKLETSGKKLSAEEEKVLTDETMSSYEREMKCYYAASQLWVDEVIKPSETRSVLARSLEACNHAPIERKFNVGVIQT